jgi:hypothetical protein
MGKHKNEGSEDEEDFNAWKYRFSTEKPKQSDHPPIST